MRMVTETKPSLGRLTRTAKQRDSSFYDTLSHEISKSLKPKFYRHSSARHRSNFAFARSLEAEDIPFASLKGKFVINANFQGNQDRKKN